MRKLFLLSALVLAALAVMAPSASATETIAVYDEDVAGSPVLCGSTAKTDCDVHIVSNGLIELEDGFGGHNSNCNNEYALHVNGSGSGSVDGFAFIPGDAACANFTACSQPWTFNGEEDSLTRIEGNIAACIDGVPFIGNCSGTVNISLDESLTNAHTGSSESSASEDAFGACRVKGSWNIEAPDASYNAGNLHAAHT